MAETSPAVPVPQGILCTVAGRNEEGCKDGPALEALLLCPLGLAAARDGSIYFSENNANLIKMLKNGHITTVAGCGAAGMQDGLALEARFNAPWGLAIAPNGALYIADCENGRIRMLKNGHVSTVVEGLQGPRAVAVGTDGALYIAEFNGHRIKVFKNGELTRIAGTGVAGFSEGPALSAKLVAPVAVALGPDDESLYILDWGNNCVRMLKDGELHRIAGDRKGGFADGPALFAKFNRPRGLVIGHDGVVYISDSQNHSIRMLKDGFVTTIAGTGSKGSKDGPALSSRLSHPSFLDIGSDGLLYVACGDHKIRTLTVSSRAARMRPRSTIHLISSINIGTDAEVKISDSSIKLHRCLAEIRCPELLENEGLKRQNVDQQAITAFQNYIYSDELPDESSPRTLLGIAYLFQQSKLDQLAIECFAQLQALAGSTHLTVEQILGLYCYALDLNFADGQKVTIFLLRSCKKPPIKAAVLRKALQGRPLEVFDSLLDELISGTPVEEPFDYKPTKLSGVISLEQALQLLLKTQTGADFTIVIEGEKPIKCHKFVLAARWPYFSKMANSGMRESTEMLLQLPATGSDCGMHPVVLQAILEVCYTGQISYDTSTLFDPILALHLLATSALYLGVDNGTENTFEPLLELAEHRISSGLNVDNCVEVFRIAYEIGRTEAASKAKSLIVLNRMTCLAPDRVSEVMALPPGALSSLLQDLRFL